MYSVNLKKDWATRGASACAARAKLPFEILRFACFKIDKAYRHQYWTFEVGRSICSLFRPGGVSYEEKAGFSVQVSVKGVQRLDNGRRRSDVGGQNSWPFNL
jgi:hypothetical protein